jgi:allantoinase
VTPPRPGKPPFDLRLDARAAVVGGGVQSVTIGVAAGRIVQLAPLGTPLPAAHVESMGSDVVLLPGLVDSHVHINEPGHGDWEGFASATRAAAAGGIAAIIDMPLDNVPATTTVEALHAKQTAAAGQTWVDVGFWAGIVPENVADGSGLAQLAAKGICGFKCFLGDSGNPDFPPLNAAQLRTALVQCAQLGLPLLVHAESQDVLRSVPRADGPRYADYLRARPDEAEVAAVAAVVAGVCASGARAHIVHVSSAAVLDLLAAAQAEGLPITAETCPHYLVFDSALIGDGNTEFACNPPIRSAHNAQRLWDGLRAGTLSMIVSDHSPGPVAAKRTGDFGNAWGGISSLQLGLSVMWTAAAEQGLALTDLVRWMAQAPAELAGLTNRGEIRVGAAADFCAFDPGATWQVQAERLWHRQRVTAYQGRTLRGAVRTTWVRGRRVDVAGPPTGRLLGTRRDTKLGGRACVSP